MEIWLGDPQCAETWAVFIVNHNFTDPNNADMTPLCLIMPPSLSVRPSVCPSVPYGLVTGKRKNAEKSKLVYTFPMARVSGLPISQLTAGYCHFGWLASRVSLSFRAINRSASGFPNALVFCCVRAAPSFKLGSARMRPRVSAEKVRGQGHRT